MSPPSPLASWRTQARDPCSGHLLLPFLTGWLEMTMCKLHREEKYFYFLNVICACECVSRSSENTQRSRCSQSQVHTIISQVPVSHQVYDHLGAQPLVFRQPQAITSVHRLRHVTMVHAGSGNKKPQGMLTGSLTLTRKIPRGKLITFLKLLKPRRPEGPQHITLDFKRPVSSHILEQAGWGADGPSKTNSKLP